MGSDKIAYPTLVSETAGSLSGYLGKGVSIDSIVNQLDDDPVTEVEDLSTLLEYYFILTGKRLPVDQTNRRGATLESDETGNIESRDEPIGVLDFVSLLPHRLRSLERSTRQEIAVFEGEVRGQIDWSRTIKQQATDGANGSHQYACSIRERTIQTKKNQVLITLLYELKAIVDRVQDKYDDGSSLDWLAVWGGSDSLADLFYEQLDHVNLRSLDVTEITVDDRMLSDVKQAREPLYREAAELLETYNRITQEHLTEQEAKQLLRAEPFVPAEDDDDYLFELYWIFEVLDVLGARNLKHITSDSDLIAQWHANGSEYRLYNDWNGMIGDDTDYLEVSIAESELQRMVWDGTDDEEFAHRRHSIPEYERKIGTSAFNFEYGNRQTPDIVLMKLDPTTDPSTLEKLFIGEVKYSVDNRYLKKGIRQLLEYGLHVKLGDDLQLPSAKTTSYIAERQQHFDGSILQLGYFVGHKDAISGATIDGIHVYGYGDTITEPFETF